MMITDGSGITAALLCVLQLISASPPPNQPQKKCGLYGQAPCTFVPAPPGMTPKCASPGKTFCEQNLEYPAHLIQHLVEQLGYHRILADEERVDFNAHSEWEQDHHTHHYQQVYGSPVPSSHNSPAPYQGYTYDIPKQQQQHYQQNDNTVAYDQKPPPAPVPQPIYIPKPQYSFNYHTYVRPPVTQRSQATSPSSGGNFYLPPVTQFSPAEWLKRFARDLSEKQNPSNGFNYHRVAAGPQQQGTHPSPSPFKLPPQLEVKPVPFRPVALLMNETAYHEAVTRSRQKRQVTAGRIELCQTREMYVTPQAALNTKGNWMYVVNHNDSRQLVKAEICTSSECSNLCSLPNGYNSRCEQKFSQKRLLTLDADGQSLYVDTYWFPSCCVCTLAMSN